MPIKKEEFVKKFEIEKGEFYDPTPFIDGVGFSVKKKFKKDDSKNTSLISIIVSNQPINKENPNKFSIRINATYGRVSENNDGVYFRNKQKFFEPVDFTMSDEFTYNTETEEVYQKGEKICPPDLLNYVYNKHIKSTKFFKGFWLRLKFLFWKDLLYRGFLSLSNTFSRLLFIFSGDWYYYEPFSETEKLNDKVIKTKYPQFSNWTGKNEVKLELKEGKKIPLLGYEASYWAIIAYSLLHAIMYSVFMHYNYKPVFLKNIFKTNFLTVIYVIITLWMFEKVICDCCLKFMVRFWSKLSFKAQYKEINI